jgi:cysteinyl-tRNA synthetase
MIRVYNTLSKNKEAFETVQPGKVGIYLCGPTVYKPSHIGHMVGPVIFDAIKRYLIYSGYEVTWVVNITDVDDKLIVRARERNLPIGELAEEMTADYMKCLAAMGVDTIDHFPKATEYIPAMIEFITDLVNRGFAYDSDGDVYFDVSKMHDYGKLSHRPLEQMQLEGGSTAERKRSPADFALWKSAKPGEPSWPSPWGPGRPGWHIECSVMSSRLLGETFDIHGGGLDLVFPHHENEIAQSECRHGKPMARYWLHNGLMQASDEVGKVGGRVTRPAEGDQQAQEVGKIAGRHGAKSFLLLLEEEKFDPEQVRFFLLSTHYRRPIDFSVERIREVATGMDTFYRFFKRYQRVTAEDFYQIAAPTRRSEGDFPPGDDPLLQAAAEYRSRFLEAMDDDFNTGGAIGLLFEFVRRLNKFVDDEKLEDQKQQTPARLASLKQGTRTFKELAATVGLFRQPPQKVAGGDDALLNKLLGLLVEVRAESRKAKNFAMADKIRNRLGEMGVILEDHPTGTEWIIQ